MTCPWMRTTTREPRLPRALPHPGRRDVGLVASTALLTTATILPRCKGALSAPQDAIGWAMTFDFGHGGGDAHDRLADRRAFAAKPVMALGILSVSIAGFLCGMAHRRAPPERASCRSCRPPCPVASPVLGSLAEGAYI